MRRIATLLVAALLPLTTIAAGQGQDPPEGIDHLVEVSAGETQQVQAAGGTGGTNLAGSDECASSSYHQTCEKTLALFLDGGTALAQLMPKYPSDYDLAIYLSDETGALVEAVASSANRYTPLYQGESAEFEVEAGQYYVLIVRYFGGGGGYFMNVGVG